MEIYRDFNELLESFNAHEVEYLIVGGYALALHGAPRYTGDLDLLVNRSPANVKKLLQALDDFGFGSVGLKDEDFLEEGRVVQLGVPPVRVDILTSLSGVSWDDAWNGKIESTYGGVRVVVIGREEFLKNKRALGRTRDLADIEALEQPDGD